MPRRMREHPTGRDTTYCGYEVSRTLYHILLPLARNGGYFMKNEKTLESCASDARNTVLAVSYTHLDVYKRQSSDGSRRMISSFTA